MIRLRSGLVYIALVSALVAAAIFVRYLDPFFVQALRLIAFDNFQRIDPETYDPNLPVRVVDLDEESLAKIGQWPWPRTTVATLLQTLTAQGAAAVAFDILFAEPDRTSLDEIAKRLPTEQAKLLSTVIAGQPTNDQVFAAALKDSPSVLAASLGDGAGTTLPRKAGFATAGDDPRPFVVGFNVVSRNLPILDEAARGIGAFNWLADRDQIVRRVALMYRLGSALVPSLAAEALRVAQGASTYVIKAANASGETAFGQSTGLNHIRIGKIEVPTDSAGGVYLKFRHFNKSAYIPAWKVLAGKVSPDEIDGRIILDWNERCGIIRFAGDPARSGPTGHRYSRTGTGTSSNRAISDPA